MEILQTKTTLNLKTLNGERYEPTVEINGLENCSSKGGWNMDKIFKNLYQKSLVCWKGRCGNIKKIEDWDYLKAISSEIIQSDDVDWCQLHEGIGTLEDKEQ